MRVGDTLTLPRPKLHTLARFIGNWDQPSVLRQTYLSSTHSNNLETPCLIQIRRGPGLKIPAMALLAITSRLYLSKVVILFCLLRPRWVPGPIWGPAPVQDQHLAVQEVQRVSFHWDSSIDCTIYVACVEITSSHYRLAFRGFFSCQKTKH